MWTNPSDEIDRRSARLKIKRTTKQLPSSQTGAKLLIQTWEAVGTTPTERILYIHGALAHSGRDAAMFEWMVRRTEGKLAVHAIDLVGHGLSTGPRAHVDKFSVFSNDFLNVYLHYFEQFSDSRFYFMGHSLGGLVVLKTMLEEEQKLPALPAGVILSNPCIRPHKNVDFPKMEEVLSTLSKRFPQMRLPRILKGKDLVMNSEAANQFETDPLIPGFMTARMAREIWYAAEEVRSLSYFVKVPTLFLISDQDRAVDREATLLFARGIDKKWVKTNHYKNAAHELLHENIRQKVWRDTIDWIGDLRGNT